MTAKYDTLAADQDFSPNPSGSSKVVPAEILVSVSSPLYPVLKSLGVSTLSIFPL
jgi:hypothetical protein